MEHCLVLIPLRLSSHFREKMAFIYSISSVTINTVYSKYKYIILIGKKSDFINIHTSFFNKQ